MLRFKLGSLEEMKQRLVSQEAFDIILMDNAQSYGAFLNSLPPNMPSKRVKTCFLPEQPPSNYAAPELLRHWMTSYIGAYTDLYDDVQGWMCAIPPESAPTALTLIDLCQHCQDGNPRKQAILAYYLRAYHGDLKRAWAEMILCGGILDTWDDLSRIYVMWVVPSLVKEATTNQDEAQQ